MIARRLLRDDWWKVAAYTGVLLLNLIATIVAHPTFQANYEAMTNFIPDFMKTIKDAVLGAGSGGLNVFLALNHLFKGANVIGPAMAIVLALGTVVREVETGTIGLLLSRPVSRARILSTFFLVHALELVIPLVLVTAAAPALARVLIDKDLALGPLLVGAAHASLFVVAIYALALLAAVVLTEQIKVAAVVGGLCVLSFLLYFIEATRPWTLYDLSSIELYSSLARGRSLPLREPLTAAAILVGALGTALAVFRRRSY